MRFSRKNRDSFEDDSLFARYVKAPLGRWGERIGHLFHGKDRGFEKRSFAKKLLEIGSVVANYTIVGPVMFLVSGWASTRRGLPFVLGLPAVSMMLISVAPGLAFNYLKAPIRNRYDALAARAISQKKVVEAELFSQKVFSLASDNKDLQVRLASAIGEKLDSSDYAFQLIEQLALSPTSQDINAHLWVAQHLMGRNSEMSDEDFALAEHHLQQALAVNRNHFSANRLAYEMYTKANRPEQAIEYIQVLVKDEPLASHLLLKLQKDLGREAEFQATLNDVLLRVGEVAARNPNEIALWGELVACSLQGERFQDALQFIQQGKSLASDPIVQENLSRLASGVLLTWHDKIINLNDKTSLQAAVKSLNYALAIYPSNGEAILRASNLYLNPSFDSKRVEWVLETLESDPNMYCSHLLLGWRALFIDKENGVNSARSHWTIANSTTEVASRILARLAAGIAEMEEDKIPFAMQVIEIGMSVAPTNTEFGLARSMILMKQQKWLEARKQLEEILPLIDDQVTTLQKLVLCCEKLGDPSKAADYQLELDKLRGQPRSRM